MLFSCRVFQSSNCLHTPKWDAAGRALYIFWEVILTHLWMIWGCDPIFTEKAEGPLPWISISLPSVPSDSIVDRLIDAFSPAVELSVGGCWWFSPHLLWVPSFEISSKKWGREGERERQGEGEGKFDDGSNIWKKLPILDSKMFHGAKRQISVLTSLIDVYWKVKQWFVKF